MAASRGHAACKAHQRPGKAGSAVARALAARFHPSWAVRNVWITDVTQQQGKAIVLLGHGSRDPLWRRPLEAVAERLGRTQPATAVRCAYLELEPPDLATAVAQLVAGGARYITVVPMFLGTGKHGREDLPGLVESLRRGHPNVVFQLQRPVGEDERLLDLLARIAAE